MIGEVFEASKVAMKKSVAEKEAAVAALAPTKTTREAALVQAEETLKAKEEALKLAKQAVKDIGVTVKEAAAALKDKLAEQAAGDSEMNAIEQKKAKLVAAEQDSLIPLLEGSPEAAQKQTMLQAVMQIAKTFAFDPSLMEASVKVLEKDRDARGAGFDETCMDQLKTSFKEAKEKLESQLAEGAPAKAARAAAVDDATKAKAAADQKQEELTAASQAAKEEKDAAAEAVKGAAKTLSDFMPELKEASDALDEAKGYLQDFVEGPLQCYSELKDLSEDTFKEPEPVPEPVPEGNVAGEGQGDAIEGEPAAKRAKTDDAPSVEAA
jgi:hypothetical protein